MATGNRYLQMEIVSRDIIKKENPMAMVDMNGMMAVFMKDNLNLDIEMAKECWAKSMVLCTKVIYYLC